MQQRNSRVVVVVCVAAGFAVLVGPLVGLAVGSACLLALQLMKPSPPPTALQRGVKLSLSLVARTELTHDTRLFRFALPSPEHVLGLPTGKHIYLSCRINEELVKRNYTPVSSDADIGYLEIIVKIYFKQTNPRFPDGGKMSQFLNSMKIGDKIDVEGPTGHITYHGKGVFSIEERNAPRQTRKATKLGMIAGGTGITPMLQLIRAILKDPTDTTEMWLLFANQTEDDIFLRNELEECAKDARFHLWYTVDRGSEGWKYSVGFINEEMIKTNLPEPSESTQILMCGPPPMIKFACVPNLEKLGFQPEQQMVF